MKYILILLALSSLHTFAQRDQVSDSMVNSFQQNLPIEDIVETLSACDWMVMGMRGDLTPEESQMMSHAQALFMSREFSELDSLFDHGNEIIQLYAFGALCTSHPDSLTDKHLTLLSEKGTIKIYMQNGEKFPKMDKSMFAQEMYSNVEVRKQEKRNKLKTEEKIATDIQNTAA